MKNTKAILVFAKQPELGNAKTRLAKTLGEAQALHIYLSLFRYTISEVQEIEGADLFLYWDRISHPSKTTSYASNFQETKWTEELQSSGDLGQKMSLAFESTFSLGYQKIIIIGTDCPFVSKGVIEHGFTLLEVSNAVVGPAEDGGYYLLGLKKPMGVLFESIPWSTDQVLPLTLEKLKKADQKTSLLPVFFDIDTPEDWERWRSKVIFFH